MVYNIGERSSAASFHNALQILRRTLEGYVPDIDNYEAASSKKFAPFKSLRKVCSSLQRLYDVHFFFSNVFVRALRP